MPELSGVERLNVDPKTLLVDVNIRTDLRLDKDFIASIKELGVLVPIIAVRTANGDLRVRHGHRRTVAAIQVELETVPVDVAGDEGSDDAAQIERILGQHAENVHRAGLTSAENLGVVQQLQAFGMSAAQITKRARIKRETVDNAIVVVQSDVATAVAGKYDFLTLEQAAAIAEFDDDKEAVKILVAAASGKPEDGRRYAEPFEHVLNRLRVERKERQAMQAVSGPLEEQGVKIVEPPRSYKDSTQELEDLGIKPEDHVSCPGHVAWLEEDYDAWEKASEGLGDDDPDPDPIFAAIYGCADPEGNGHVEPKPEVDDEDDEQDDEPREDPKEERRRVIANNKAWRAAEGVRRNWLCELLKGSKAPDGAVAFVFAELADHNSPLAYAQEHRHPVGCELLGVGQSMARWLRERNETEGKTLDGILATASAGRAEVIALGLTIGAHEGMLGVNTWRHPSDREAQYLAKLVEWGYQPSEIEQTVIDHQDDDDEDDYLDDDES